MKSGFTKKDLVVALGCVVFLLANIAAIGGGGRKRAREAVCLSNLSQWGTCFQMYTNDYDGFFPMGTQSGEKSYQSWLYVLQPYYRQGKLRLCPEATKPMPYPNSTFAGYRPATTFEAWGPLWADGNRAVISYDTAPDVGRGWIRPGFPFIEAGEYTSYMKNDWVRNDPRTTDSRYSRWVKSANIKGADKIPLMLDGKAFFVGEPSEDSPPPAYRDEDGVFKGMRRFCIDRHNGAINVAFADSSARKVGLKELWTLKWNLKWDECGPWTTCGGIWWGDWPEWMRDFKDY